jgi:hypothetical protein
LSLNEPIYTEPADNHNVSSFVWSRDGQFLAYARARDLGPLVRVISVADGKFEEISLADAAAGHVPKKGSLPMSVWGLELDDSGKWLAVGMGETHSGLVAIANRKTGQIESVLDGFPIWVNALRFVGPDLLLTGTWNGRVQLWDLRKHKPLWTTETQQEQIQFGYVHGSPYVACGHLYRSGTVLRLEDGKTVYKTPRFLGSDSRTSFPCTRPQLIGRSTWALEMDPESMQIRLVDIATGCAALTYCALPDGQWIIYTPSGDWDSSERVHDWVKFCDGLKPLPRDEAERRHRRKQIESVLKQAFPQGSPSVE